MGLWVKHKRNNLIGRIVGWCPDRKGRPMAMVQVRDRIFAFKLSTFKVVDPPSSAERRRAA